MSNEPDKMNAWKFNQADAFWILGDDDALIWGSFDESGSTVSFKILKIQGGKPPWGTAKFISLEEAKRQAVAMLKSLEDQS
jgi:hypothetical protein